MCPEAPHSGSDAAPLPVRDRRSVLPLLLAVAGWSLLGGCGGGDPVPEADGGAARPECLRGFPELRPPTHAELFSLRPEGAGAVLEVWPGGRSAGSSVEYLLVRRGCERTGAGKGDAAVVEVPVERLATTSTTEIPFLELLDRLDVLVAHSGIRYVSSAAVRERHRRGDTVELGPSGALDLERLIASGAEVVLASPGGDPWLETLRDLDRAPTELVEFPSFREASPLGRAEWILAVGALVDRVAAASEWFAGVERRYRELREHAGRLPPGPRVVTGAPAGGVWYAPTDDSFVAGLLRDGGGRSVWQGLAGSGARALDFEAAFALVADAEVWIQPGLFASVQQIREEHPRLAAIPALAEGRVWTNDASVSGEWANDYWETGVARPDLVLADFLEILHPEASDHELVFHRRLPGE